MRKKLALTIIMIFAIAGMLFSGYLSYSEIFAKQCLLGCSSVSGIPACVYGLIMYLIVFIISILGLTGKK